MVERSRKMQDDYSVFTLDMSVTSRVWHPQVENASTPEEIINILRQFNLDAIANRLTDLRKLVEDDPEESPMELESLRSLATFLMSEIRERQLPEPEIGVTPDGLVEIAWSLPPHNGILAMDFLLSGQIQYTAISAPAQHGVERKIASGTSPKDEIMKDVQSFISLLGRSQLDE